MRSALLVVASARSFALLATCAWAAACSASTETPPPEATPTYEPVALPVLTTAKTTLDRTIVPKKAPGTNPDVTKYLFDADVRASFLSAGFGDFDFGPPDGTTERSPPNMSAPAPGPNKHVLTRFVHMPDLQLADDEAPTRLVRLDSSGPTSGAYRPQESAGCRVVNAAVRTINALHKTAPIDFVLLGGDNADNAQDNEVGWVLDILGGAPRVECDSGADDDPVKGAGNDAKDPFVAPGLAMPFYWVNGNHDVLVQGNFVVNADYERRVLGTSSSVGTIDWRLKGGGIGFDDLPADPRRKHLRPPEVLGKVAAHKGGHGLSATQAKTGRAFFTFDIPNTPFRFVVLDTAAANSGGAEGVMRKSEVDQYVKPALDQAKAEGKLVLLASHHALSSLTDGSGLGGVKVDDAMTQDAYRAFLGGYDNVLFSLVGHTHEHRVRYEAPPGGHGFWEVMTSALADFPQQIRIIELIDDDNGWLRLRATLADYATDGDPVAAEARKLGILDLTTGWTPIGTGTASDRNVELLIKKP
ncbi:MAG: metallophosphoesterase [Polyangiaceae bacterium]